VQSLKLHWPLILRSIEASIRDVGERGFCLSVGEWRSAAPEPRGAAKSNTESKAGQQKVDSGQDGLSLLSRSTRMRTELRTSGR
jgi:hypothetical protein